MTPHRSSTARPWFAGFVILALCATASIAQAELTLTPAALARSFTLEKFATGFASAGGYGPIGIAVYWGGGGFSDYWVLVTDYPEGKLYKFKHFDPPFPRVPGTAVASYGANNAFGLCQLKVGNGYKYYLGQSNPAPGRIIEIDNNGVQIGTAVVTMSVEAIIPYPPDVTNRPTMTGHLFATDATNIWNIDPVLKTRTLFASPGGDADGLCFTEDGNTLYVALNDLGIVRSYNSDPTSGGYGSPIWNSPVHPGPDGTAIGTGILAGYIYVNCNDGNVREFGVAAPHLGEDNVIATGGSRGDFIGVDTNQPCNANNPSLLLTQSTDIWRLDPPGGGFFGPPASSLEPVGPIVLPLHSSAVPTLGMWGLLLVSATLLLLGGLFIARRRGWLGART